MTDPLPGPLPPGRTRRTSPTHPLYRLDTNGRIVIGVLASLGLWSDSALARVFGVSRRTVYDNRGRVAAGHVELDRDRLLRLHGRTP